MTTSQPIDELFLEAIRLPASRRTAFVESCSPDPEVRSRLAALLEAHEEAPDFLESPAIQAPAPDRTVQTSSSSEEAGAVIGRYRLLQPIGEGGFGTVWMAEQKAPVKRRVALKIIKLGMDTKQVIARFEAERQALAMMDHPNIARVLDAGATETGRPYFVMEYVRGVGILEYCDTEKLDTGARLRLFTTVCQAIQHAHQKGIIHRDIKPSNVMVTMHDGVPVPKVIDFGVAKATNTELTQKTLFTEHRQMIGTPAYMSPEQAEMSGLDIDTRSDIYSLGVLLYELLTGTTPFDTQELASKGFAEMMRIIREHEPHKPSTRLSTLGATATRTADQRRADPRKLGGILRGDLDWIVMKCLEKDRTRRYETANGLAADIDRHLRDEPVVAGPPSSTYRMRKFLHRNRTPVMVASLVFVFLVIGFSVAVAGFVQAKKEKRAADELRVQAEESERQARDLARVLAGDISLAVVPLSNASGDPEQEYFAAGMTRSLIDELSAVDDTIGVTSYESVAKLASLDWSPEDMARELDVDLLLTGSVLRVSDQVQITMTLDHPGLDLNLWQNTYTGDWSDLFRLQHEVSEDTVREVRLNRTKEDPERHTKRNTIEPQAREAYFKGMYNLQGADDTKTDNAIEFFEQAIALDPDYALAHLGMANAYLFKSTMGVVPEDYNEPARRAAQAALDLDDTLAGAWAVLGQVHLQFDWDWEASRAAFEKALALDPYLPAAHAGLAGYYVSIGEFDLSIEHLRKAIQIDPAALLLHEAIMYTPFFTRRMDVAIEICQHALDLDESYWSPHAWMGQALSWDGQYDLAIVHLKRARELEPKSPIALALLASVHARKGLAEGDRDLVEQARVELDELLAWSNAEYICPYEIATVFVALGDTESALQFVELAEHAQSECIPFMGTDIRVDELQDHPDFQGVMERVEHPLYGKPKPWLEEPAK